MVSTVLERLSLKEEIDLCSSELESWVEITGRQFSALCKEECFSIGHWGTLNSSQFLSTEDVDEEVHNHVSWMLFKDIPFGGERISSYYSVVLIQAKLGFTPLNQLNKGGFVILCISHQQQSPEVFTTKYLRTSCSHENFQESGTDLCSFFQSVLLLKKKKKVGVGRPSQPCSVSTLIG